MSVYNNPHAGYPTNMYQQPQQGGFIRPGMQPGGYPQQAMYAHQPQQGMYPQQPVYQQPQQHRQPGSGQDLRVMNTPQGLMMVDAISGQILGPVQQQQQNPSMMGYSRSVAPNNPIPSTQRFGTPGTTGSFDNQEPRNDNRYGALKQLIAQPPAQQEAFIVEEPAVKAVKEVKEVCMLPGVNFNATPKLKGFTPEELHSEESSLVGGSLQEVITTLISIAHGPDKNQTVWHQSGIVLNEFYDTSVKTFEDDLFQSDPSAVHKVVINRLKQVKTRADLVYFEKYNKWLTEAINSFLESNMKEKVSIDSFSTDFVDLVNHISDNSPLVCKALLGMLGEMLEQAKIDVTAVRCETDDGGPVLSNNSAVVPERVSLVYIKLLAVEMGDNGTEEGVKTASLLMDSIIKLTEEDMFYMITMDRKVYKVTTKVGAGVTLTCVSE